MTINPVLHRLVQPLAGLLLIISGLLVVLVFIGLGLYAQPSADDFCMAYGIEQRGFFTHLWAHYQEWSGRYSGNALYALYPLIFGMLEGYQWMPVLLILSLMFSTAYFLARLFRLRLITLPVLLISLGFVVVYLLMMKHTASSLYWMAGALSYLSANIFFLLTLALLINLNDRQSARKPYSGVLLILLLLTVAGVGTNETNMLMLNAVMTLLLVIHFSYDKSRIRPWLLLWLVTLACSALVYFAPGNDVRESSFALKHDWVRALGGSLEMGGWTLISWITNPLLISATILTPFTIVTLYRRSGRDIIISNYVLLALLLVTLAIPIVLQFPAWWAMGGWPPPRTVDAIFFSFLLSWLLLTAACSIRFLVKPGQRAARSRPAASSVLVQSLLMLAFCIAIFTNGQFQRAWEDLSERAKPYHAYLQQRYRLIDDALENQQPYLQVPAFQQEYPRSIYFNDIVPNWGDWRNVCYASYFGLQGISRHGKTSENQ